VDWFLGMFAWVPKVSLGLLIHYFDWWTLSSFLLDGVNAHEEIGSLGLMWHHLSG